MHDARPITRGSPQHSADPRQQLTRPERFDYVIVGPNLKQQDLIHFVRRSAQNDDGRRNTIRAKLLAYFNTA
jgi:hypothetical protein